jgi:hypothetical protein
MRRAARAARPQLRAPPPAELSWPAHLRYWHTSRPAAAQPRAPRLQDEIADALERIIAGPEKKGAVMSEKKKRLVAYHEAGHALVSPPGPSRVLAQQPARCCCCCRC